LQKRISTDTFVYAKNKTSTYKVVMRSNFTANADFGRRQSYVHILPSAHPNSLFLFPKLVLKNPSENKDSAHRSIFWTACQASTVPI